MDSMVPSISSADQLRGSATRHNWERAAARNRPYFIYLHPAVVIGRSNRNIDADSPKKKPDLTAVDGGATAKYTYDALNRRIRQDLPQYSQEFLFNPACQRVSIWNPAQPSSYYGWQLYWGSQPLAFNYNWALHFQHQDWLGTERMQTSYNGAVESQYTSLPFADGNTISGLNYDQYDFAGMDYDAIFGTQHAQFRQYTPIQGRWMSPDPYVGSYDMSNPQSMNRYSYVENSPMAFNDPSGLDEHISLLYYGDGCWGGNYYTDGTPDPEMEQEAASMAFCVNSADWLFPDAGGGDGGGGSASSSNSNSCPQTPFGTPAKYCGPLQQGLIAAMKALRRNRCSAFYGGQGEQTLEATTYRFLPMADPTTGAETVNPTTVFINSDGPYMNYTPMPGEPGPFDRYWTQSEFRGFILLHELGHQLSPLTGFQPDANSPLNQVQSGQVISHCF